MRNRPKHEPTNSYFYLARHIDKCMMRAYAFNLHVDPVITKMTGMQQIRISHVCNSDERKLKEIPAEKTYRKFVIRTRANKKALSLIKVLRRRANKKAFTKTSTHTPKDAIDETKHEEPLVIDNLVINEIIYFNLFECGKIS